MDYNLLINKLLTQAKAKKSFNTMPSPFNVFSFIGVLPFILYSLVLYIAYEVLLFVYYMLISSVEYLEG